MGEQQVKEAYIELAGVEEFKKQIPPGAKGGYNFGFVAPVARLLSSHPTLGPTFHAHFPRRKRPRSKPPILP